MKGLKSWLILLISSFLLKTSMPVFILTLETRFEFQGVIELYMDDGCRYGEAVLKLIDQLLETHEDYSFIKYPSQVFFPSPTLRLKGKDGYLNFIGENNAKNAIETLEKNLSFS
jgi:hypothetical protein